MSMFLYPENTFVALTVQCWNRKIPHPQKKEDKRRNLNINKEEGGKRCFKVGCAELPQHKLRNYQNVLGMAILANILK